jgi:hypothetical protein
LKAFRRALPAIVLGLLLLTTCSDDDNPADPSDGVMRLHGTVVSSDGPMRNLTVKVDSRDGSMRTWLVTDSQGAYEVFLPIGRYVLSLTPSQSGTVWYASTGLSYRSNAAETIVVTAGRSDLQADFRLAHLQFTLRAPFRGDHSYTSCDLYDGVGGLPVGRDSREVSDSLTTFEFPALIPGRYFVRVETRQLYFWFPHTLDSGQAEAIEVHALGTSQSDTLGEPAHVRGVVVGPWMDLADHSARIGLLAPDMHDIAVAYLEDDGRFDIPVLAEGSVRLVVDQGSVMIWLGGTGFSDADLLPVTAGAVVDVGSIQTHGIVCRLAGDPQWRMDAWRCLLVGRDRREFVDVRRAATEGLGIIPLEAPGSYRLEATGYGSSDWRPQWYDRATSESTATEIVVDDAVAPAAIEIQLERGGSISGRVVLEDGTPVTNALMLAELETFSDNARWQTDDEGTFRLRGLPDGPIRFAVHYEGARVWYPGTLSEAEAEPIEIVDAGDPSGFEIVVPPLDTPAFLYVGVNACKPCHMGEAKGRIWETWKATEHASAYDHLDLENRGNPSCLACHTTGYGDSIAPGRDWSDLLAVQCEACHGPGSEYKSLSVMKDPEWAEDMGLIHPDEGTCLPCHTSTLPRDCWGDSNEHPVFDYAQARAAIAHHRP